jgi:hypothetical protein
MQAAVVTACPTCAKPLAGRGKCKSYAHRAIGPRRVGSIIDLPGYGTAEVIAVEEGDHLLGGWSITERDLTGSTPGRIRIHCTAWEARRGNKIIGHVAEVTS